MLLRRLGGASLWRRACWRTRVHGLNATAALRCYKPARDSRFLESDCFKRYRLLHSEAAVPDNVIDQHFIENELEAPLLRPELDENIESSLEAIWSKAKGSRDTVVALKAWVGEGNTLSRELVNRLLIRLCARRQHLIAYLVARWVEREKPFELSDHEALVLLHFAALQRKEDKARVAFNKINQKTEVAHTRLLKAYADGNWDLTADRLFKEMKDENLITTPEAYNLMMAMYSRLGELEKARELFLELEASGISPDAGSYQTLLENSTIGVEDVEGKVRAFLAANAGDAVRLTGRAWRDTISLYGRLGAEELEHVNRLWSTLEAGGSFIPDSYYFAAAEAFGMAGDMEKFEQLCNKMQTKNQKIRPDQVLVMVRVYSAHHVLEKAELVLQQSSELGHKICCSCYEAICCEYMRYGEMRKAFDKLQELLKRVNVKDSNKPFYTTLLALMEEFGVAGLVQDSEALMQALIDARYRVDARLFNQLLQAYVTSNTSVEGMEERMKLARVIPDKETERLLQGGEKLLREDFQAAVEV